MAVTRPAPSDEGPHRARSGRARRLTVRRYAGRDAVMASAVAVALLVGGWTAWSGAEHRGTTDAPLRAVTRLSPVPPVTGPQAAAPTVATPQPGGDESAVAPPLPGRAGAPAGAPPGGVVEPPLPAIAGTPADSLTVRFQTSTRWDGGLVGYFAITNTTPTPVHGWRLVVTVPASFVVTASWEATMRRTGNTITFASTATSADVGVGATVRFGLQAMADRSFQRPQSCVINNASCA